MLEAPSEHAPRLFGPRPGDAVGMLLCCWRCDAFLTGRGLPRLRLYYSFWKNASRAELLGVEPPQDPGAPGHGPLDACHYCGAEQDWLAYLRSAAELYRLAEEADEARDKEQGKLASWFSLRRVFLRDPPWFCPPWNQTPSEEEVLRDRLARLSVIDDVCGSDDAAFRRLARSEVLGGTLRGSVLPGTKTPSEE